jgi:hypothetical protein
MMSRPGWPWRPELVAELEAIGGDVVVVDSPDVPDRIKAAVGQAELRLALDGVSGPATGVLAATLSPHGTLVSFAAMSEGPMSINPLDVIFKPLTMRGCLGHPEIAGKIGPAIVQAAAMIASGPVHIPVAAQWPRPTPSPRSNSLSPMRCRAEKSFWMLPDHPPDLGIEHSIWPPRSRSTASIERSMSIRLPFRPG